MIDLLHRFIIPAAYSILPPVMASDRATAMLLAIALQESYLEGVMHRKQIKGPARSFWMFERSGGIAGVLAHPSSREPISRALGALRYRPSGDECYTAIAHNDVLAACFARCLLWTLPGALTSPLDVDGAWHQYVELWKPGAAKPGDRRAADTRARWNPNYKQAWSLVAAAQRSAESMPNRLDDDVGGT